MKLFICIESSCILFCKFRNFFGFCYVEQMLVRTDVEQIRVPLSTFQSNVSASLVIDTHAHSHKHTYPKGQFSISNKNIVISTSLFLEQLISCGKSLCLTNSLFSLVEKNYSD